MTSNGSSRICTVVSHMVLWLHYLWHGWVQDSFPSLLWELHLALDLRPGSKAHPNMFPLNQSVFFYHCVYPFHGVLLTTTMIFQWTQLSYYVSQSEDQMLQEISSSYQQSLASPINSEHGLGKALQNGTFFQTNTTEGIMETMERETKHVFQGRVLSRMLRQQVSSDTCTLMDSRIQLTLFWITVSLELNQECICHNIRGMQICTHVWILRCWQFLFYIHI